MKMTKKEFETVLENIKTHPAYNETGDLFVTAFIIERLTGDTSVNQSLSLGLCEGWIDE
jgi:hypothetical protein